MHLTYRGTHYQRQSFPSQDANISAIAYKDYPRDDRQGLLTLKNTVSSKDTSLHLHSLCKYRGVTYQPSSPTFVFHKPVVAYKYRGVYYITGYC